MKAQGIVSNFKLFGSLYRHFLLKPCMPTAAASRFSTGDKRHMRKHFMPIKRDKAINVHVANTSYISACDISSSLRFGDIFCKSRKKKTDGAGDARLERFAKFLLLPQTYNLRFDEKVYVDNMFTLQKDISGKSISTSCDTAVTPLAETVGHGVDSGGVYITGYPRGQRLSDDSSNLALPLKRTTRKIEYDNRPCKYMFKTTNAGNTKINGKYNIPTNIGTSLPLNLFEKKPLLDASYIYRYTKTTRRLSYSSNRRHANESFEIHKLKFGKGNDLLPFITITSWKHLFWLRKFLLWLGKRVFVLGVVYISGGLVSDPTLGLVIHVVAVPVASYVYGTILRWLGLRSGKAKKFKSKAELEQFLQQLIIAIVTKGILYKRWRRGQHDDAGDDNHDDDGNDAAKDVRCSDVETAATDQNNMVVEEMLRTLKEKETFQATGDKIATTDSSNSLIYTQENLEAFLSDKVSHTFRVQDFTEKDVSNLLESLDKEGIVTFIITQ